MELNTLCVIGAGAMGTGIAQVAAQAGIRAHLLDVTEEAIEASRERLSGALEASLARGRLTHEQADGVWELVRWHTSDECLAEADWAVEAVVEDMGVKCEVLQRASALLTDGVPLASNTSTFRIGELAEAFGRPAYFLGMHFFNPPPAMKLVEVIPGEKTLPEVTDRAVSLCERLGKTAIIAPDVPGFLVNRAFAALAASAIELWAQGGAPEAIDGAIELGLGHKMGPLRTADLVGLDVMLAMLRSLHEQTGHPRFEAPAAFAELVASGKLGRKSGRGFYAYEDP